MKICKDGRIWGQNNKEAGSHLGLNLSLKKKYIPKGRNPNSDITFLGKHHTEDAKIKISKAHKGKQSSEECKRKISEALKGEKNPLWKGGTVKIICKVCGKERANVQPSQINKGWGKFCSLKCVGIWTIKRVNKKDTDIESLIENELIRRCIPYSKQVALLGITLVDFLLPHNIVIYCDGSYWHSFKKTKIKDFNQNFMLTFYGYKVFRFSDKEIKKSVRKCINKIIKV